MVEYKIFRKPLKEADTPEKQEKFLNEIGADGWKCFRMSIYGSYDNTEYLFYCWKKGNSCPNCEEES